MNSTRTTNVALPEALRAESGESGESGEHVDALIRKHQRELRILRLRSLVEDGLASGKATPDRPADWDELAAIARGEIG